MNIHGSARTCPYSRALLVQRVQEKGESAASAARQVGVSERTVYKWLARARGGDERLWDRSSRPATMPTKTPSDWEALISALRDARKTGAQIASDLGMPRSTVARVLKRLGKSRLPPLEPPPPVLRYEWAEPGDMLHIDVKKLARFRK